MFGASPLGGRFRGSRRNGSDEPVDVDLIPIMNLFVTIIPFLLLGVSFYQIAGIATSVPTRAGDGRSDVAATARAVTLTVGVSHTRGYVLRASGTGVAPDALQALALEIPKAQDGAFDCAALTRALLRVKQAYAESDTVVLVPDADVLFADLVRTMDAARDVILDADATPVSPRLELFPRVVLASRTATPVTPDRGEGG